MQRLELPAYIGLIASIIISWIEQQLLIFGITLASTALLAFVRLYYWQVVELYLRIALALKHSLLDIAPDPLKDFILEWIDVEKSLVKPRRARMKIQQLERAVRK